jgi:hypothetical protein
MLDGNKQRVAFLRKTEEALAVAKPQRVNFGNSNGAEREAGSSGHQPCGVCGLPGARAGGYSGFYTLVASCPPLFFDIVHCAYKLNVEDTQLPEVKRVVTTLHHS